MRNFKDSRAILFAMESGEDLFGPQIPNRWIIESLYANDAKWRDLAENKAVKSVSLGALSLFEK